MMILIPLNRQRMFSPILPRYISRDEVLLATPCCHVFLDSLPPLQVSKYSQANYSQPHMVKDSVMEKLLEPSMITNSPQAYLSQVHHH